MKSDADESRQRSLENPDERVDQSKRTETINLIERKTKLKTSVAVSQSRAPNVAVKCRGNQLRVPQAGMMRQIYSQCPA